MGGRLEEDYLSFTLRQGSIDSSFAAIFATQPCVTLLRYTIGVLPINCINMENRKYPYLVRNLET
jgi:hypothetical protein